MPTAIYLGIWLGSTVTGGSGPPPFSPSMDFSDSRNSMYVSLISAFTG